MFPTEVLIHDDILTQNFRILKQYYANCSLAPVIKSDGYGHGLIETARAFVRGGAERVTVFRLEEALQLRQAGYDGMVWLLLGPLPDEADMAADVGDNHRFACPSLEAAQALSRAAQRAGRTFHLHLKVDTGMGRLGVLPEQAPELARAIMQLPGLQLHGVFTHCAIAGQPEHPVTQLQVAAFRDMLPKLPSCCRENHLAASSALLNQLCPELPFARPGICLYCPCKLPGCDTPLQGAMTLRTKLISVKELPEGHNVSYNCIHTLRRPSKVAIAPLGYADGYPRELSNRGTALIHGRRVPILGTVCMSMIMLDVTDIPETVSTGDEAVFLGRQGEQEITIWELAGLVPTTPHVPLCLFGSLGTARRIHL